MPKKSRKTVRMLVRRDLREQLKQNETAGNHYEDLIEDYMALWDIKEKLILEINKNGTMIEWKNGAQTGRKKNDAVSEFPKVNKQMLSLLKELGLEANRVMKLEDDGNEDEL